MTICIAAVTHDGQGGTYGGPIVTVSDRMLSAPDDSVPGTEAGPKSRKISKTWALMFAGESNLFLPIVTEVAKRLGEFDKVYDLETVQSTVSEVYRAKFSERFSSAYLSRYGVSSISEFRTSGLLQFGEKFYEICNSIDEYNIGLIY